jgi:sterol desaturase/sphingolipid hydroxylase (fatty acid hydroxylase superfamily)
MAEPHARNAGIALGALLASSATLVCCVLPAALVSIGAGAALVTLVGRFPQLVWLSEHKAAVFGLAAALLGASGVVLWRARSLPCPTDPALAQACMRLRRISAGLYGIAVVSFVLGAGFAFLPAASEPVLRLATFAAVFAGLAWWEAASPRRPRRLARAARWPGNLGVLAIDTLLVRVLFPTAAVGIAVLAAERGWGVLARTDLPPAVEIITTVLVLDLAIYAQHALFHRVPVLWRLHRMHHADLELDLTTGVRFHPLEILLSMLIKGAVIVALGAHAAGVLIFEALLNATSMFNHANVRMPARLDALLRRIVVTPDMHRVHHSIERVETDSNFGFNLSWWDRLFGTYRSEPRAGHLAMTLGIEDFRSPRELRLDRLLLQPFVRPR